MRCSYENQAGFDGRRSGRTACFDCGRLLLLADGQSVFLEVGAGCHNWFSPSDLCVYHLFDHIIYPPHTIAPIPSCTECSADRADNLTARPNR